MESALAAERLVTTWDQNAVMYACSPAAAVIEKSLGWTEEPLDSMPSTVLSGRALDVLHKEEMASSERQSTEWN